MLAKRDADLRSWGHRMDDLRLQAFQIYQNVREAQREAPADMDECLEDLYTAADAAYELACRLVVLAGEATSALEESGAPAVIN
jgi:hypothetical protein